MPGAWTPSWPRFLILVRARRPLFAALAASLLAGGLCMFVCLLQRGADADQLALNERAGRAFILGWTADGTALAGRRVAFLIADCVKTPTVLDLPAETTLRGWARWALRRLRLKTGSSYAGLFEGAVPVPEWMLETRGWAVRRDETVGSLASQIMSLVEAHGTVDLVVQGEAAGVALPAVRAAEKLAPPESRVLVRKVVVLGMRSKGLPARSLDASGRFEKPGRVKEWVFLWREPPGAGDAGGGVTMAEAFTRGFKGQVFDGEDLLFTTPPKQGWYSDKEIIVSVQRLLQSDRTMEEYMLLAQRQPPPAVQKGAEPPTAAPAANTVPEGVWHGGPSGLDAAPAKPAAEPGASGRPERPAAPGEGRTAAPGFMPFPAVDSSSLASYGPGGGEAKPPPEEESACLPGTTRPCASPPPEVEPSVRLIERSVALALELAKWNVERASHARSRKRERMAEYLAAKAAAREAAKAREAEAAREAAEPPAAQMPPAAPQPSTGGRITPFKSGPKVTREDLGEPAAPPADANTSPEGVRDARSPTSTAPP
ncbi:MAG: hypothetical protein HY748_16070 [Elusimicrobia bacterium]|nr:hypothetical protein [Elusimicrobiota bacterium]